MLWDASSINGCAIEPSDGRLGAVSNVLFEDGDRDIRWLVVGAGMGSLDAKSFSLFRPRATQSRVARISCEADYATGQGQPGYRHGDVCVAADGGRHAWK